MRSLSSHTQERTTQIIPLLNQKLRCSCYKRWKVLDIVILHYLPFWVVPAGVALLSSSYTYTHVVPYRVNFRSSAGNSAVGGRWKTDNLGVGWDHRFYMWFYLVNNYANAIVIVTLFSEIVVTCLMTEMFSCVGDVNAKKFSPCYVSVFFPPPTSYKIYSPSLYFLS